MSKPRFLEILTVAAQILAVVVRTAADIVDDAKVHGCAGYVEREKEPDNE